jgi:hypothetical protein
MIVGRLSIAQLVMNGGPGYHSRRLTREVATRDDLVEIARAGGVVIDGNVGRQQAAIAASAALAAKWRRGPRVVPEVMPVRRGGAVVVRMGGAH